MCLSIYTYVTNIIWCLYTCLHIDTHIHTQGNNVYIVHEHESDWYNETAEKRSWFCLRAYLLEHQLNETKDSPSWLLLIFLCLSPPQGWAQPSGQSVLEGRQKEQKKSTFRLTQHCKETVLQLKKSSFYKVGIGAWIIRSLSNSSIFPG